MQVPPIFRCPLCEGCNTRGYGVGNVVVIECLTCQRTVRVDVSEVKGV